MGCSRATYPSSSWKAEDSGLFAHVGDEGGLQNRTHGVVVQQSQQSDIPVKPDSEFLILILGNITENARYATRVFNDSRAKGTS